MSEEGPAETPPAESHPSSESPTTGSPTPSESSIGTPDVPDASSTSPDPSLPESSADASPPDVVPSPRVSWRSKKKKQKQKRSRRKKQSHPSSAENSPTPVSTSDVYSRLIEKTRKRSQSLLTQRENNDNALDIRPTRSYFRKHNFDTTMKSNRKLSNSFKSFCKSPASRRFIKNNLRRVYCEKYLEEICDSIVGDTTGLRAEGVPELVECCSTLHSLYEEFVEYLIPVLERSIEDDFRKFWSESRTGGTGPGSRPGGGSGVASSSSGVGGGDDSGSSDDSRQRLQLSEAEWKNGCDNLSGKICLLVELFLVGLYDARNAEGRIVKLIRTLLKRPFEETGSWKRRMKKVRQRTWRRIERETDDEGSSADQTLTKLRVAQELELLRLDKPFVDGYDEVRFRFMSEFLKLWGDFFTTFDGTELEVASVLGLTPTAPAGERPWVQHKVFLASDASARLISEKSIRSLTEQFRNVFVQLGARMEAVLQQMEFWIEQEAIEEDEPEPEGEEEGEEEREERAVPVEESIWSTDLRRKIVGLTAEETARKSDIIEWEPRVWVLYDRLCELAPLIGEELSESLVSRMQTSPRHTSQSTESGASKEQ